MDRAEAVDAEDHHLEDHRKSKTLRMKLATLLQQARAQEDI